MQTDALTAVSWRATPRSFVALMALYESNYIRLSWLAGDPRRLSGQYMSAVAGDCDLYLTVLENSPYTTTFDLTYELPSEAAAPQFLPDLGVRIYHDARLAEAAMPPARAGATDLAVRWARNMTLNKWLEYCADRGHRFTSATGPTARHP